MTLKLTSARIQNFKSLGDVTLNFRDLTILVGPNSSGKSNCLQSLNFLNNIVKIGSLYSEYSDTQASVLSLLLRPLLKHDSFDLMNFKIFVEQENHQNKANYQLGINILSQKPFVDQENLLVGNKPIIRIKKGQGKICDENEENTQPYKSNPTDLALKTAGNFGEKPFTFQLSEFIKSWRFYDLDPNLMKYPDMIRIPTIIRPINISDTRLDLGGRKLQEILLYWSENDPDKLQYLNEDIKQCLGITLKPIQRNEPEKIFVIEKGDMESLPSSSISDMSDGTLRMIAYYVLLYQDNVPPLIGIEEPEKSVHPGMLLEIASILKRLSKRTQVIITTHSSQLLDCFTFEEIRSDVAVILLNKKDSAIGTQAIMLDKLAETREDLAGWMQDFGVGSAVYDSNLLQDLLDRKYA